MTMKKRVFAILGVAGIAAMISGGAALASSGGGATGAAGQIDDGAELLSQASITLEEAISAAQAKFGGQLGEVDLETYRGKLVFNVDIGKYDVKVDAASGAVLGQEAGDGEDSDDDDSSDGDSSDGNSFDDGEE